MNCQAFIDLPERESYHIHTFLPVAKPSRSVEGKVLSIPHKGFDSPIAWENMRRWQFFQLSISLKLLKKHCMSFHAAAKSA